MKGIRSKLAGFVLSFVLLLSLVFGGLLPAGATSPQAQYNSFDVSESHVIVRAIHQDGTPTRVLAPFDMTRAPKSATITINFQGTWDTQAQAAFNYAASIWEALVTSSVPIVVDAYWSDLGSTSGILGGAAGRLMRWPTNTGPFEADVWYSAALVNALAGSDYFPGTYEIYAQFNSARSDWYFGTAGNPGVNEYDFVSVVLHELGHGLGFSGSMAADDGVLANGKECGATASTGEGCWGYNSPSYPLWFSPTRFDKFAENGSGQSLLNTTLFPNPSIALGNQLMGGDIFFDGTNANSGNGGSSPELYAPGTWLNGTSFSHLDETVYPAGNNNSLMTPYLANGEVNHYPGPVTLGIFKDLGWTVPANTNPSITISDVSLLWNGSQDNAIDLFTDTTDSESPDQELEFDIIAPLPNASAGVTLDDNRYIDINPTPGWTGSTDVTIEVADPAGGTSTDTFKVTVVEPTDLVYLPLVQRE